MSQVCNHVWKMCIVVKSCYFMQLAVTPVSAVMEGPARWTVMETPSVLVHLAMMGNTAKIVRISPERFSIGSLRQDIIFVSTLTVNFLFQLGFPRRC